MSTTPLPSIIDLHEQDLPLARTASEPLLNSGGMKAVRLDVPQGSELPRHSNTDQATLHCLAGSIVVELDEDEVRLSAGQMILLEAHQPHAIRANVDSILLLTMRVSDAQQSEDASGGLDPLDQTADESFPASDPPSWTPITGP